MGIKVEVASAGLPSFHAKEEYRDAVSEILKQVESAAAVFAETASDSTTPLVGGNGLPCGRVDITKG